MSIINISAQLINLPRTQKRLLAIALDVALSALTVWLAWSLRLERWMPPDVVLSWATTGAILIGIPVFTRFGLYAAVFRYAGWNAMLALVEAVALYSILYATVFGVIGIPGVPRSVGFLQPLLMFIAVGASRVGVRLWLGGLYRDLINRHNAPGVLIYGAGAAGMQLAAALSRISSERLVGFLDDNPLLQGRRVDGLTVFPPEDLATLVPQFKVRDVLLAIPSAPRKVRKEILNRLRVHKVYVRTLPGMDQLIGNGILPSHLQEVAVEDLLGRDPVQADEALMRDQLTGKTVLVTGAGGSIGSELCRQVLRREPNTLLMLDHSENALYLIKRKLGRLQQDSAVAARTTLVPLLGSVVNELRLHEILSTWAVDVIYHAAAYKHVPMVERNPGPGLYNNVCGTLRCATAAAKHGVGCFVLISTDKAVRPTNVMGASKRLAEMVVQAMAARTDHTTCYTLVRFGNVLGSSGSVVPLFRRQIAAGGPVTVTHRDMVRYFMTIPEAAELVIQAGTMAQGGDLFVLDMGEPVHIYDLARQMIELTGRRVYEPETGWGDIEIKFTGTRPGEKLYEELLIDGTTQPTGHPRIQKAQEQFVPWDELQLILEELDSLVADCKHAEVRQLLRTAVTGYHPEGPIRDVACVEKAALAEAHRLAARPRPAAAAEAAVAVRAPH